MVGTTHVNPLNLPPSKEIKKIEIQKVVEGFDMEQNGGIEEFASNINTVGEMGETYNAIDGGSGNVYSSVYDNLYEKQYTSVIGGNGNGGNDISDLSTDLFHTDSPNDNTRRRK